MYTIKIGNNNFKLETDKDGVILNDKLFNINISPIDNKKFHVIRDNRSYNIEIVEVNQEEKFAAIKVNNTIYKTSVKDRFDELLKSMGLENLNTVQIKNLKAPMPGLVLKVLVAKDDEIKKGDSLLVLEAMKMENLLKAPADVKIKEINIIPGDKVEKNQILINFY